MILLRCYAKITDWLFEFSGHFIDWRALPIYSYGFFVAMGFLAAAYVVTRELKRREALGFIPSFHNEKITIGESPKIIEAVGYFITGFLLFFKLIGLLYSSEPIANPQQFIFSMQGNWIAGIIGGIAFAAFFYYEKKKLQLPEPIIEEKPILPSEKVGDMVMICGIFGILGSVLFNYLESPESYVGFWDNPIEHLFSGLSVYGGMICAGLALFLFTLKNKFNVPHTFDSLAYCFILAVGIGRLGCQVSGDADWGIPNLAPKPAFVPQLLWADNYEHNIADEDADYIIPNCVEDHCHALARPVFPTPLYEFLQCTAIFIFLHFIRKKLQHIPGLLFFVFCILIGIQRYSIEQLRAWSDRSPYMILNHAFKQAELISIGLVLIGLVASVLLFINRKKEIQSI